MTIRDDWGIIETVKAMRDYEKLWKTIRDS